MGLNPQKLTIPSNKWQKPAYFSNVDFLIKFREGKEENFSKNHFLFFTFST
jgi:hypothetical protein